MESETVTVVIDFWGLCMFDMSLEDNAVTVCLPNAKYEKTHWDGTEGRSHQGLIYVKSGEISKRRSRVSGPAGYYSVIDLDYPGSRIEFGAKIKGNLQASHAREQLPHVPNFRDCAPGIPRDPGADMLASLRLSGGCFSEELCTDDAWQIEQQGNPDETVRFAKIAYVVRWVGKVYRPDDRPLIEVYEDRRAQPYAWLTAKSSEVHLSIGNVDNVVVPFEDAPVETCPEEGPCIDRDFKWFHRLFWEEAVRARGGGQKLIAPEMKAKLAGGTPTCFPGGC